MKRPVRFSLGGLFWALTLLCVGLSIYCWVQRSPLWLVFAGLVVARLTPHIILLALRYRTLKDDKW